MKWITKIVGEICKEKGIDCQLLSKDWVMKLTKEGITRYIIGNKFDLNHYASGKICDDKYAFYEVIKQCHLPVVEHYLLYRDYDRLKVEEYFQKWQKDVVVKINTGTCGNQVYHIETWSELLTCLNQLLSYHHSVSLTPFYPIKTEYRVIVLNGSVVFSYGKRKPIVEGDGKRTKKELLCQFNPSYFNSLEEISLMTDVLKEGEVYEYHWQFNLSKGAIPFMIDQDPFKEKIEQLALEVARCLNLTFASVDIVLLQTGTLLVLEANSGVMMDHFVKLVDNGEEISKTIYTQAIELMFSKK